jgi:hypothetical protein
MLTVYVSPDGWVERTANEPVRGTGDAAGEAVGEAEDEAVGDAAAVALGEVAGEMTTFAEGDVPGYEPGPPQATMIMATASNDVECFTADTIFQRGCAHGVTFPVRSCT